MKGARDFSGGAQRAKEERKVGRRYRGRSRRALRDAGNIEFPVHGCSAAHDVLDVERYGMTPVAQRSLRDQRNLGPGQRTFTNCETLRFGS